MKPAKTERASLAGAVGGAAIAVPVSAIQALDGNYEAAALLTQYWWWSHQGTREFLESAARVEKFLRIGEWKQRRCRKLLVERGWLIERTSRRGGKTFVFQSIDPARVKEDLAAWVPTIKPAELETETVQAAALTPMPVETTPVMGSKTTPMKADSMGSKNADKQEPLIPREEQYKDRARVGATEETPVISSKAIASGSFDAIKPGTPESHQVFASLLNLWEKQWKRRAGVQAERDAKAFQKYLRAGGTPSTAARAIVGMRHDPWEGRSQFCSIEQALKPANVDRFAELFETSKKTGAKPVHPAILRPANTKPWRGYEIPKDYHPDDRDADHVEMGDVFVLLPDVKCWVSPAYDPRGYIPKHRALWGDLNVPQRAREQLERGHRAAS